MNVPAAVEGGVVVIPVLPFADACVDEMETCAIVFRCQCKGDLVGLGSRLVLDTLFHLFQSPQCFLISEEA